MGATKISYLTKTWNPVVGCNKCGPGCRNCWAEQLHNTRYAAKLHGRKLPEQYAKAFHEIQFFESRLNEPLKWRNAQVVGVCFTGDLFHEQVPFGFIMRTLDVMARSLHEYFLLTKRVRRMASFFVSWEDLKGETFEPKLVRGPAATRKAHPSGRGQLFADMLESMGEPPAGCVYPTFDWMEGMIGWPSFFTHIHLGASAWDQHSLDEIMSELMMLSRMGWSTWLSLEPLLGPIDLRQWLTTYQQQTGRGLSMVIAGGEHASKASARPCDIEWMRSLANQCASAGVPFYLKQLGSRACNSGFVWHTKDRAGADPAEWPEDLRKYHQLPEFLASGKAL